MPTENATTTSPVETTITKLPSGPQDCLTNSTFVITGVFSAIERDDMVDFIKQHGGRVTTSVSSRTTYLIAGMRLEDGRPVEASKKYRTAKSQSNCTIISENDIIQMVQDAIDQSKNTTKKKISSSSNNNNNNSSSGTCIIATTSTTTTTTNNNNNDESKKRKANSDNNGNVAVNDVLIMETGGEIVILDSDDDEEPQSKKQKVL